MKKFLLMFIVISFCTSNILFADYPCWELITKGKFSDAQNACEEANRRDPNNLAHIVNLGSTYLLSGDIDKAKEKYQLIIKSGNYSAIKNLNADLRYFIRQNWSVKKSEELMQWSKVEIKKLYGWGEDIKLNDYIDPPFGVKWNDSMPDVVYKLTKKFKATQKTNLRYGYYSKTKRKVCKAQSIFQEGQDLTSIENVVNKHLAKECSWAIYPSRQTFNGKKIYLPATRFKFSFGGLSSSSFYYVMIGDKNNPINIKGVPCVIEYVFHVSPGVLSLRFDENIPTGSYKDGPWAIPLLLTQVTIEPTDEESARRNEKTYNKLFLNKGKKETVYFQGVSFQKASKGGSYILVGASPGHVRYVNLDQYEKIDKHFVESEATLKAKGLESGSADVGDDI